MKKIAMSLVALAIVASGASAAKIDEDSGPTGIGEGVLDCSGATMLTCGGTGTGVNGPGGTVALYGCTGLDYDFATEVVYEICTPDVGDLTVQMNYVHDGATNDLDLFVLGSCDPADCLGASTAVSGFEEVVVPGAAAGTYYAVVDGWNGLADGSPHDLAVICATPCATPVLETTWGAVKSIYAGN